MTHVVLFDGEQIELSAETYYRLMAFADRENVVPGNAIFFALKRLISPDGRSAA